MVTASLEGSTVGHWLADLDEARKVDAPKQGSMTFPVLRSFSMRFADHFMAGLRRDSNNGIEDAVLRQAEL
jgi:DNA-binding transcriptional ArsR family regulator